MEILWPECFRFLIANRGPTSCWVHMDSKKTTESLSATVNINKTASRPKPSSSGKPIFQISSARSANVRRSQGSRKPKSICDYPLAKGGCAEQHLRQVWPLYRSVQFHLLSGSFWNLVMFTMVYISIQGTSTTSLPTLAGFSTTPVAKETWTTSAR